MRIAAAATLYFVCVYAAGFALGTIRVFVLEPRLGPLSAVLCEAPFLLVAIVIAARWAPRVARLKRDTAALALTGVVALVFQQIADFALGVGLRGQTPATILAHFTTPPGLVYAALLAAFAAMPLIRNSANR